MEHALITENNLLRRQLQQLLDEARLNDKKFRRLNDLEKQLIATRSLSGLIQIILADYKSAFEIDAVTLVLVDTQHEIRQCLEMECSGSSDTPGLVLLDTLYDQNVRPHLGCFDAEMPGAIFDPWPIDCLSMVLLPLQQQGVLIGSLNLGSCTAERFAADSSTDFLERLAAIFSVCLENALNHERLKRIGLTDPLTGVHNRRYFETRCIEEISHARRHRRALTCMFLDIDKFKRINDSLGHPVGDEVLRNVAKLIKLQLRGNDVLARYGGEEFIVLLPRTNLVRSVEIAERIRAIIAAQTIQALPDQMITVTISIGIAVLPEQFTEENQLAGQKLIAAADAALYLAKEGGRNRVVCAANPSTD